MCIAQEYTPVTQFLSNGENSLLNIILAIAIRESLIDTSYMHSACL
jgi:hypothetical protein